MRGIRAPPKLSLHHHFPAASPGPPRPAPHSSPCSHHGSLQTSPCATDGSPSTWPTAIATTPSPGDSATEAESSCCPTRNRATDELCRRGSRPFVSEKLGHASNGRTAALARNTPSGDAPTLS